MKRAKWSVKVVEAQAFGCDLVVKSQPDGAWTWFVKQDGRRVADGVASTLSGGQSAAEAAAQRHIDGDKEPAQMALF